MSVTRVGIIGAGFMGRTIAETVTRYLPDAKLVAIAGGTRAEARASAAIVGAELHWLGYSDEFLYENETT